MSESFENELSKSTIDPSNVIIQVIEETFLEIIKKIIVDEEEKNKYTIILNDDVINIINKIISQIPNKLNDIEKSLKEVIKDGKINVSDIPELIILVQSIYQVLYHVKDIKIDDKKRADITARVLKLLIHILVEERKIKVDKNKKELFYKETDLLIDSCVSLLVFPKIIKSKTCFNSIFG
jgi:hypothetical protein